MFGRIYNTLKFNVNGSVHRNNILICIQQNATLHSLFYLETIAAGSSNAVTNTRCCIYICLRSWWWVELPPEICRAVSRCDKLCNVAFCWIHIRITLSKYMVLLLKIEHVATHEIRKSLILISEVITVQCNKVKAATIYYPETQSRLVWTR